MSAVHNLENTLRRHDEAFANFWDALHVDYGNLGLGTEDNRASPYAPIDRNDFPILKIYATPQKAAAKVSKLLVETGWIAGADAAAQAAGGKALEAKANEDFAVLPLPLLTLRRNDPVQNPLDSGVPKIFRRQCIDPATGLWQQHQWPGAYETTYTATLWCLKRYTEVFVREYIKSQLGTPGVGEYEVLIPVVHESPWGTIQQRLVWEATGDLSELEGADQRYLRFEYSFRLRTWLFRKVHATVDFLTDFAVETVFPNGVDNPLDTVPAVARAALSGNYFSFFLTDNLIPAQWPKAGNATVQRGRISPSGKQPHNSLRIEVTDTTDEVLVSNRMAPLDGDGRAIMTMTFKYRATEDVDLITAVKAPPADPATPFVTRDSRILPAKNAWTQHQFFMLLDESVFSMGVLGRGTASRAYLADVRLLHVFSQTKLVADSEVTDASNTTYTWNGRAGNFLAVVVYDTGAAAGTITIQGIGHAATPATQAGLVVQLSPDGSGDVVVVVPNAIPTVEVYLQDYLGFWDGTEI